MTVRVPYDPTSAVGALIAEVGDKYLALLGKVVELDAVLTQLKSENDYRAFEAEVGGMNTHVDWSASATGVAVGDTVKPTGTGYIGLYAEATAVTAGNGAASEPTWPTTVSATVVENSDITWTMRLADSRDLWTNVSGVQAEMEDTANDIEHLGRIALGKASV